MENVRVVQLEHLRVAAALGFGPSPEPVAWDKVLAWLKRQGVTDLTCRRFFGFNNPSPTPASPNYGYEQWVTLEAERDEVVDGPEGLTVKTFPGGLYAVMRCQGIPNPQVWGELVRWRDGSAYQEACHQWLEECLTPGVLDEPQVAFDLYLPVALAAPR